MNVTGVGSSFSFVYDKTTHKISTKDGSKSEFVDYLNGDISESDTENLNFYDRSIKLHFDKMLQMCSWGMMNDSPLSDLSAENEVEIDCNISDSNLTEFYVNGKKSLVANVAVQYTDEEIETFRTFNQPYKTQGGIKYNPDDNSIRIGVGSVIDMDKGYRIRVYRDGVHVDDDYRYLHLSEEELNEMDRNQAAINRLIHFADGQNGPAVISSDMMPFLIDLLEKYGVDTSREFTINDTKCIVDEKGRIRDTGKSLGVVPDRIQSAALQRYEDSMLTYLKDFDWTRKA